MNNRIMPAMIRIEDIARIRREMYIGKVLEKAIRYNKLGERLVVPERIQVEVCGIYPHLVEVKTKGNPKELPIKTITYVDMLLKQVKEARGEDTDV